TVYEATWVSKKLRVACKVFRVRKQGGSGLLQSFKRELNAYREVSGAYILKIYGYAVETISRLEDKCYLVMEYMAKGSLACMMEKEKISYFRKVKYALHVARGMHKLHQHNLIHRDIRPANILVDEHQVAKIGDMGITREVSANHQHTMVGYNPYMPPEFYLGRYSQKLDVYTFGLTLNEFFTEANAQLDITGSTVKLQNLSPILNDFILRCINYDPNQRPTSFICQKTLALYVKCFTETINKKHRDYDKSSTEKRNSIFKHYHERITARIREELNYAW
ncbi:unnamed protein product, partial [Didymodactylos carnosus]